MQQTLLTSPIAKTVLHAGCKINIILRVDGVLPNGMHTISSVFLPLPEPHDDIIIMPSNKRPLHIECSTDGINKKDNTLISAYNAYADFTGFAPCISIDLRKGIPHCAGLGGGSSDAGALLLWLQKQNPNPASSKDLHTIAGQVGSDTPFFLQNTPCLATGTGTTLTSLPNPFSIQGNTLVLVCPDIKIETPWAYKALDTWRLHTAKSHTHLTNMPSQGINTMPNASSITDYRWLENDFEPPVFSEKPKLRELKEDLLKAGARTATLSGTGATIWALFKDKQRALTIVNKFHEQQITAFFHVL